MDQQLYSFFQNPHGDRCFFSGEEVLEDERIPVFPQWIIDRYQLKDKTIVMLNWNRFKYGDLFIPCSKRSFVKVDKMEKTIQNAFEGGYEEVLKLDKDIIFLWMTKITLGILYHDIRYSMELSRKRAKAYKLSALLTRKFTELHYMLQSLVRPVRWTVVPYSMVIKKLNYSKDIFNFRDETHNLNFSLGMNGFGILACLQDMGFNVRYNDELLKKMGNHPLHAIQFEELCVRFVYSNFLLRQNKGWNVREENGEFVMSPVDPDEKPVFNEWDDKMYASALQGYWEPWGLDPKQVYSFPDSPLSFLIDETTNNFIKSEDISLPT
jgi:hypothetical protein